MPRPPIPPDLKHCPECGKVMGYHKGWFGPQCFCGKPAGETLGGAHGAGMISNARPLALASSGPKRNLI